MAKKLRVEVEADTAKAKRKLDELASGAGSAGVDSMSGAADRAARSLDKVSRSAGAVAEEAGKSSSSMTRLVRSFAGLGAGMAAGYAANYMSPGIAKTSMGYAGAMLVGASTGARLGSYIPGVGTVVGGAIGSLVGAGKQWLDNDKTEKDWFLEYREKEQTGKEAKVWAQMFEEMTSVKTHFKGISGLDELKMQLEEVNAASQRTSAAIEDLKRAEAAHIAELNELEKKEGLTAEKRIDMATREAAALETTRQKIAQTEGAAKNLSKMRESLEDAIEESNKPQAEARSSFSALDALARVGGNFAGGDSGFMKLQRVNEQQVELLKKIEAKTGKGAGTF